MINDEMMETWEAQKNELIIEYAYLSHGLPVINSTMFLTTIDELCNESNLNDVDFQLTSTEEALAFSTRVTRELTLNFLSTEGTYDERHKHL